MPPVRERRTVQWVPRGLERRYAAIRLRWLSGAIEAAELSKTTDQEKTSFETFLTTAITKKLNDLLLPLRAVNEWHLTSEKIQAKSGAIDITLCDKQDLESAEQEWKNVEDRIKVKAYGIIEAGIATGAKKLRTKFFEKLSRSCVPRHAVVR